MDDFVELKKLYVELRDRIDQKLEEFKGVWLRFDRYELLYELIFCLLTPQSRARVCWEAVLRLRENRAFELGDEELMMRSLSGVRFPVNKTGYIMNLREMFYDRGFDDLLRFLRGRNSLDVKRKFLVRKIKGIGYKEASHFLRNIWIGRDLAILDRHILKNLERFGVIDKRPKNLSDRQYMELERKMKEFCEDIDVKMRYLDFIFWYMETGEIFK